MKSSSKATKRHPTNAEDSIVDYVRIQNSCPECNGKIRTESSSDERACDDCGLIIKENSIDHGPEWRAFDSQERGRKSRVGSPVTNTIHDKGLSTNIGWQDRDANGNLLSSRKRETMKRLRKWDLRCKSHSAKERNLKQAFTEVDRMASALGLPQSVRETASMIYRRAVEEDVLVGRSIEEFATAALYGAARKEQIPRTLDEVTAVARVGRTRIARAYRTIVGELGLAIEPSDPTEYLPRFTSDLDCSQAVQRRAYDLLETVAGTTFTSGKHPAGLAAAALYAATCLTGERVTQEEIGEASDVTPMTIRTHYRELLRMYSCE